jgi:hypothetical protein
MDGSDKINCVFYNEECEKYYNILQVGKVYEFSRGIVKLNNYSENEKY